MKDCICKRTYHRTRGIILQNKAEMVKGGIFKHKDLFVNPPFTKAAMKKNITDYTDKRIAHDMGGTAQNRPYVVARIALMEMIDGFADYVDIIANGDKTIIRMAGFEVSYDPAKLKGKKIPANIERLTLKNVRKKSGVLVAECEFYPPRTSFIGFLLEGFPLPAEYNKIENDTFLLPTNLGINIRIMNKHGRRKIVRGLKPGVMYYIYYLAINNHGCSNLSKAASVMCM